MTGGDSFPKLTLILGHASSGKSAWAEGEVRSAAGSTRPTYVATARLLDEEMRARARRHAQRRGAAWDVVEADADLATVCSRCRGTTLIDCATLWLTGLVMDGASWEDPLEGWITAMRAAPAAFWVVSNDVGGGVTPDNAMARRFQRDQGAVNQRLAAAADSVALVTAGLAQWLK